MSATWNDSLVDPPEGAGIGPTDQVEDYLAGLPEAPPVALEKLGKTIKAAAPSATETISYQMPTFKLDGRFRVSYAAFKNSRRTTRFPPHS
jgi:uncharacterized protein YdhG (YjbR/CyaY superfamily)